MYIYFTSYFPILNSTTIRIFKRLNIDRDSTRYSLSNIFTNSTPHSYVSSPAPGFSPFKSPVYSPQLATS